VLKLPEQEDVSEPTGPAANRLRPLSAKPPPQNGLKADPFDIDINDII
jgi:hypothetical protein